MLGDKTLKGYIIARPNGAEKTTFADIDNVSSNIINV